MKNSFLIRNGLFAAILLVGMLFVSCQDDIVVAEVDKDDYLPGDLPRAYVVDSDGKRATSFKEFREEGSSYIYVSLDRKAESAVAAQLSFDEAILESYNEAKGTDYELFPAELVSFEEEGVVVVNAGEKKSAPSKVTFKSDEALELNKSYVIPILAELKSTTAEMSESSSQHLIFVKDLTSMPSADKESGIKVISCMEVNDTNPLNNLSFRLKNSGKPLIDIVIMFSANINYNDETGRVYVHQNPEVTNLLADTEKYIKPLQDAGMKVVLGILGNHDRASVTNLATETAIDFAQELKAVMDAYNLDGVFWDDEYSKPIYPSPPGFVNPGQGTNRLMYETKKAMPDKLNMVYQYGGTSSIGSVEIDGEKILPGEFIDWAIADYGQSIRLGGYQGLEKSGGSPYSQEFTGRSWASDSRIQAIRDEGWGGHMIFAMDPYRSNVSRQISAMQSMARILFDDELEVIEPFYPADHKP